MTLTDLLGGFIGGRHRPDSPYPYMFVAALILLGLLLKVIGRMRFVRVMTPEQLPDLSAEQVHAGRQCFVGYLFTRFFSLTMLLALLAGYGAPKVQSLRQYAVPWAIVALGLLGISIWLAVQARPVARELVNLLRGQREADRAAKAARLDEEGEELDRLARRDLTGFQQQRHP